MSLSKVTVCLWTFANAATHVSAPTIKTTTMRFTIDFIYFSLDYVGLRSLSASKHHSQFSYDKISSRLIGVHNYQHAVQIFASRFFIRLSLYVSNLVMFTST